MAEPNEPYLGYYPDAELVIAIVCPLGADHTPVVATLADYLTQFGYRTNPLRLSELFPDLLIKLGRTWDPPEEKAQLAAYKIGCGNQIRELTKTKDVLARIAASMIADHRAASSGESAVEERPDKWKYPLPKTAHIISTLKRPQEVDTLRRIYGSGFFMIGLSPSKEHRDRYFAQRGINTSAATGLIAQDAAEVLEYGQQTRETFHLADVFISTDDYHTEIPRFLDLVFGCPTITPTSEEQAMFMAYSASLRSGDLSRQVGAAIVDEYGDLLSVGCNEVPRFGGGLYGPEPGNNRDIARKCDSNEVEKNKMIAKVLTALGREDLTPDQARKLLKPTGLPDITEFGRSVHAEMDALLAGARTARGGRGATLFTTTFPCHNCCRHILAAGIKRVVYIEPYAKSKAPDLHGDAISIDEMVAGKLPFLPFIGVGPRRYFDLFSLRLSTGYAIERKEDGKLKDWTRHNSSPRLQMQPTTYLDREALAWESIKALLSRRNDNATPEANT
ncbi:MAG TPA: anti-phage dCTP deaminase [Paludibaculum sp.]|jgi:deoxycytidylate deaminase